MVRRRLIRHAASGQEETTQQNSRAYHSVESAMDYNQEVHVRPPGNSSACAPSGLSSKMKDPLAYTTLQEIMNFNTRHRYSDVTLSEAKGLYRRPGSCFAEF